MNSASSQTTSQYEDRQLEMVLHHMLVAGVLLSSALMLLGLVLSLIQTGTVPDAYRL